MQRYTITKDATSQIIPISIYDSSSTVGAKLAGLVFNTAGLTAYYNRVGATGAATAITMVTATKGTWTSSGFVAVDGTNMPGDYELHLPNAAIATGVDRVIIQLKGAANMVPVNIEIDLTLVNMQAALATPTNITAATGIVLSGVTHTGAVIPTVSTLTGHTAQTGDSYARIGAAGASLTALATAAALSTAQTDLNTITGSDGVTLATTQPSITFQPIIITAGDAINNITLAGTGTSDGIAFTRTGSGDPFDANFIAQINATVDTALTDYDAATGTELAATEAKIDTIDVIVDAILVDTTEIGAAGAGLTNINLPNQTIDIVGNITGNLSGTVGSVTGSIGSLGATAKTDVLAEVVKVLTTQMTEAYAADGVAPTLTQALFLIQQVLTDFTIAGTTNTIKKIDGSTTAATMTLNDGTNPTGSTRAT